MSEHPANLHLGDCLSVMRAMPSASVDAVVTDPPYGLRFMGHKWDYDVPSVEVWQECLRLLKPGGHLLAFASPRTQHRMACRIEDAGLEIRDMLAWIYGQGFPKSLDVSKAIEKLSSSAPSDPSDPSAWQGFGTALKPALEPITLARAPLVGTVAANVLQHGTGALNIDGCRVPIVGAPPCKIIVSDTGSKGLFGLKGGTLSPERNTRGRWPANVAHDGTDDAVALFPASADGSAARFFYCSKASQSDRDSGGAPNTHPTVKPCDLMRWLCRLVTPPGGVILDPFMGSGSTGKAALLEGFRFIGIERDASSFSIARARVS